MSWADSPCRSRSSRWARRGSLAEKAFSNLDAAIAFERRQPPRAGAGQEAERPSTALSPEETFALLPRRISFALGSMTDMGLTRPQAEAVLAHAYFDAAIEVVEARAGGPGGFPSEILGRACQCSPHSTRTPRADLGSNALLIETTIGRLGAWLQQERASLECAAGPLSMAQRSEASPEDGPKPLAEAALEGFDRLARGWDHSSEVQLDAAHAAKAKLLLACADAACPLINPPHAAAVAQRFNSPAVGAMRAAIEKALVAEDARLPSIAHKAQQRRSEKEPGREDPANPAL